jgi:hypothetical protein
MDIKTELASAPTPAPDSPHVNSMNHQLYNIYRRRMAIARNVKNRNQQPLNPMPTEQQKRQYSKLDLTPTGGKYNPLTIIKPLKPNSLDIYDSEIAQQRKNARGSNSWVMVKNYS